MSEISIGGPALGTPLQQMLMADCIEPGSQPSYELCKTIYAYHTLGAKMADMPVKMAQSQQRNITIADGPEDMLREEFEREWHELNADALIANTAGLARVYGIATLIYGAEGIDPAEEIRGERLPKLNVYFNVMDPLNTAGSLVLDLDPNSPTFLKHGAVSVNGVKYHRSRACVVMNERPIYILYTSASFGFVGRSVYQRPLYALKSFIDTERTDALVVRKAGVLVAKLKPGGGIIDRVMQSFAALKAGIIKATKTDNVITITPDESIESLNLLNLEGPFGMAREHILNNIAAGADMPAILLNEETYAEGFGEGTEDAKKVAGYVKSIRDWLSPLYNFLDPIVMYRAWNPVFYMRVQARFPELYANVGYEVAFSQWRNGFRAQWPSLIVEPDSEKIKTEDVKLKAIIALVEILGPLLDPENKAALIEWACDEFAENKLLFKNPLILDVKALLEYTPPADPALQRQESEPKEPNEPKPFAAQDSAAINDLIAGLDRLIGQQPATAAPSERIRRVIGAMQQHATAAA